MCVFIPAVAIIGNCLLFLCIFSFFRNEEIKHGRHFRKTLEVRITFALEPNLSIEIIDEIMEIKLEVDMMLWRQNESINLVQLSNQK